MTQMEAAKKGQITQEMRIVAKDEGEAPEVIRDRVAQGTVVITCNVHHANVHPIGIGAGLSTKINTNIGTSPDMCVAETEVEKAKIAVKYGTDTIMDLSIGGNPDQMRKTIIKTVNVPIGTVPIYQTAVETANKKGSILHMTEDDIVWQHREASERRRGLHDGALRSNKANRQATR